MESSQEPFHCTQFSCHKKRDPESLWPSEVYSIYTSMPLASVCNIPFLCSPFVPKLHDHSMKQ